MTMAITTTMTLASGEASGGAWGVSVAGVLDLLAALALLGGLFFMFVGAFGALRMPDAYHRMHAASKCTTLGLTGMLLAACLHLATTGASTEVITKSLITVAFTFIATPIGTHLLAKAAHLGRARQWEGTLSDEYEEDRVPGGDRHDGEG